MTPTRTYFRSTTPQQRRLLFETWQATGNVTQACLTARVGRRTFYYWKPRFDAQGFAGLESPVSSAPKRPHQVDAALAQQVIVLHQANPTWGKRRLAHELAKAHSWQQLISPNTVRRILLAAGLWAPPPTQKKSALSRSAPPKSPE
jgi:transposase